MSQPNPQRRPINSYRSHYANQRPASHSRNVAHPQSPPPLSDFSQPMVQPTHPPYPHSAAAYRTAPPPPRGRRSPRNILLAGGGFLALTALVVGPAPFLNEADQASSSQSCQETVQTTSVMSRAELSELLKIEMPSSKEAVRQVIDQPYCLLPDAKGEDGGLLSREAYPLEFNPETWFIVEYQGDEYVSFDFSFYRD